MSSHTFSWLIYLPINTLLLQGRPYLLSLSSKFQKRIHLHLVSVHTGCSIHSDDKSYLVVPIERREIHRIDSDYSIMTLIDRWGRIHLVVVLVLCYCVQIICSLKNAVYSNGMKIWRWIPTTSPTQLTEIPNSSWPHHCTTKYGYWTQNKPVVEDNPPNIETQSLLPPILFHTHTS